MHCVKLTTNSHFTFCFDLLLNLTQYHHATPTQYECHHVVAKQIRAHLVEDEHQVLLTAKIDDFFPYFAC